jgi:hypothetical protein
MRFLHCTRQKAFLHHALTKGLVFTDHQVDLAMSEDRTDYQAYIEELLPILENRLRSLGKPWQQLDAIRKKVILSGIGTMSAKLPMICLTEVMLGRDLLDQYRAFGAYGLVLSEAWVRKNGGDRVLYIGANSPVSRHLFRNLGLQKIGSIFVDPTGLVMFDTVYAKPVLDLLAFIETRANLVEVEWRVPGSHGLMGGERATGKTIAVRLDDLEYVLVQKNDEIGEFEDLLKRLQKDQGAKTVPIVLSQPSTLP